MNLLDFVPWGGAISKGLDVIKSLLGFAQRREQRDAGAIAQDDTTKTDTLNTLSDVNAPIANDEREQLWDDNSKRFGSSSGKT